VDKKGRSVRGKIKLTPIGDQVRRSALFAFFTIFPEYFTTLWIVNAGNPIEARL
jgi:hypothetical protein